MKGRKKCADGGKPGSKLPPWMAKGAPAAKGKKPPPKKR